MATISAFKSIACSSRFSRDSDNLATRFSMSSSLPDRSEASSTWEWTVMGNGDIHLQEMVHVNDMAIVYDYIIIYAYSDIMIMGINPCHMAIYIYVYNIVYMFMPECHQI